MASVLTCERCGMQWQRPSLGGTPSKICPECRYGPPARPLPDLDLAKRICDYRAAIELAKACLRTHRTDEALTALEQVDQP